MASFIEKLVFLIGLQACLATAEKDSCLDDFVAYGQFCFKILAEAKASTWLEAVSECEAVNGILAEPLDEGTVDFLRELAVMEHETNGHNQWFIGLTDLFSEGDWHFPSSGGRPSSTLWQIGSPSKDPLNILDCAAMIFEGGELRWKDIECAGLSDNFEPVQPVCQKIRCPDGSSEFESQCYFFENSTQVDWEASCVAKNGHLSSVHSEKEQKFINDLVKGSSSNVWLGGIMIGSSTTSFIWADGTPVDYVHWHESQPDGYGYLCLRVSDFEWADCSSSSSLLHVCKISLQ